MASWIKKLSKKVVKARIEYIDTVVYISPIPTKLIMKYMANDGGFQNENLDKAILDFCENCVFLDKECQQPFVDGEEARNAISSDFTLFNELNLLLGERISNSKKD